MASGPHDAPLPALRLARAPAAAAEGGGAGSAGGLATKGATPAALSPPQGPGQARELLAEAAALLREVVVETHGREARTWLRGAVARLPLPPPAARRLLRALLPAGPAGGAGVGADADAGDDSRRRRERGLLPERASSPPPLDVAPLAARQACVLAIEHAAPAVASLLAPDADLLRRFFTARPRMQGLFFSHFKASGEHALGAKALAHYALAHRETAWPALIWTGRHAQAPVTVAAKPAYWCELDVPRSVMNLLQHAEAAGDGGFWASEQLRGAMAGGEWLGLDGAFFADELLRRLQGGQRPAPEERPAAAGSASLETNRQQQQQQQQQQQDYGEEEEEVWRRRAREREEADAREAARRRDAAAAGRAPRRLDAAGEAAAARAVVCGLVDGPLAPAELWGVLLALLRGREVLRFLRRVRKEVWVLLQGPGEAEGRGRDGQRHDDRGGTRGAERRDGHDGGAHPAAGPRLPPPPPRPTCVAPPADAAAAWLCLGTEWASTDEAVLMSALAGHGRAVLRLLQEEHEAAPRRGGGEADASARPLSAGGGSNGALAGDASPVRPPSVLLRLRQLAAAWCALSAAPGAEAAHWAQRRLLAREAAEGSPRACEAFKYLLLEAFLLRLQLQQLAAGGGGDAIGGERQRGPGEGAAGRGGEARPRPSEALEAVMAAAGVPFSRRGEPAGGERPERRRHRKHSHKHERRKKHRHKRRRRRGSSDGDRSGGGSESEGSDGTISGLSDGDDEPGRGRSGLSGRAAAPAWHVSLPSAGTADLGFDGAGVSVRAEGAPQLAELLADAALDAWARPALVDAGAGRGGPSDRTRHDGARR